MFVCLSVVAGCAWFVCLFVFILLFITLFAGVEGPCFLVFVRLFFHPSFHPFVHSCLLPWTIDLLNTPRYSTQLIWLKPKWNEAKMVGNGPPVGGVYSAYMHMLAASRLRPLHHFAVPLSALRTEPLYNNGDPWWSMVKYTITLHIYKPCRSKLKKPLYCVIRRGSKFIIIFPIL